MQLIDAIRHDQAFCFSCGILLTSKEAEEMNRLYTSWVTIARPITIGNHREQWGR